MAFHFSLEAVLRVRRTQERAERLKLESIVFEQQRARAKLQELLERSFENRRQFQVRLEGGLPAAEIQFEMEREAAANVACGNLRRAIAELEKRRIAQVQVFYAARRNLELVDNLRVRKLNAYLAEQARREQQELDALFLVRQRKRNDE